MNSSNTTTVLNSSSSSASKSIEIDELNCTICQESYDSISRVPRVLLCGHTFCTSCLRSIIDDDDDPLCPECRLEIDYEDVDSVPVIYLVKKIVDAINQLNEINLKEENIPGQSSSNSLGGLTEPNGLSADGTPYNGSCLNHSAPRHLWCSPCQEWLCGTCAFLNHRETKGCRVMVSSDALGDLQALQSKRISAQRTILVDTIEKINILFEALYTLMDSGEVKKGERSVSLDVKRKHLVESVDMLDEAGVLLNVNTFAEWKESVCYIDNLFTAQCYPMAQEDLLNGFWSTFINKSCRLDIWAISHQSISIYFYKEVNNRKVYSQLNYLPASKICIFYRLSAIVPPTNSVRFHFSEILTPALHAFLELQNAKEEYLGRVVIELFKCARAAHFRSLCTGELGPTYKGSRFFHCWGTFCQYLSGGDYETNNGRGGKQLFDFEDEGERRIVCDMVEGVVCGPPSHAWSTMGQFRIFYSVTTQFIDKAKGPFGFVVKGLQVLKDAVSDGSWSGVTVRECGVMYFTEERESD